MFRVENAIRRRSVHRRHLRTLPVANHWWSVNWQLLASVVFSFVCYSLSGYRFAHILYVRGHCKSLQTCSIAQQLVGSFCRSQVYRMWSVSSMQVLVEKQLQNIYSRTRLQRHRFIRHLAYNVRCSVAPIITLCSSVRTTLVCRDTKYAVPLVTSKPISTVF